MQSHQDIKANRLNDLPTDMLLEIVARLRPEEAVHFFSSSAKFKESFKNRRLGIGSFWEKKLQLHFPGTFKQIKNTSHTDWQAAFIEADKAHYQELSSRDKKLFSIVKEGDIESFIDGEYLLEDLLEMDSDGTLVISCARNNQALLDYVYDQLVLPYFTIANGSLDLTKRDKYRQSILHWAAFCRQGQDTIVALITAGINIDVASSGGATPLFFAAFFGHLDVIETLITQGANVDAAISDGVTPLYAAAQRGYLDVAEYLLAHGANVNAAKSDGVTPLYVAAYNGHLDVVETLIAHGANVDAATSNGATPLYIAAQNGHLDVVETLIAQGANVNAAKSGGATPLYVAAENGHLDVVERLIAQGANVNAAKPNGETPLDIATKNGHREVANALVIAMLQNYIEARSADTAPEYKRAINVFGLFSIHAGNSKNEKVAAATMLKCVLQGADPANLKEHENALNHGDLGKIFSVVENDIERRKKDASPEFRVNKR